MIILAKIHASLRSWLYLALYPLFIYSWIPITVLGFIHRHDHEWSHRGEDQPHRRGYRQFVQAVRVDDGQDHRRGRRRDRRAARRGAPGHRDPEDGADLRAPLHS